MIGVAWLSCQNFQRTLCVEALVIARDILLVIILEFLHMQQIVSAGTLLKATFKSKIADRDHYQLLNRSTHVTEVMPAAVRGYLKC